jgi:hypothetical protein
MDATQQGPHLFHLKGVWVLHVRDPRLFIWR